MSYCCIMMDITSGCNLRCKFCVQDWKCVKENFNTSKETFKKIVEIIPLAHDEWFFFSCAFESTIHPQFFELFESIPKEMKPKIFFTTNLAKKFTVEQIERISKLNISIINISFESFNPSIYEELRSGAKYINFINNLENLVKAFRKNKNAPQIRYISMLFKQNLYEVEAIVKTCNEKYSASSNEFRTPFPWTLSYNDTEWLNKSMITLDEYNELAERIEKLPYNIKLYNPSIINQPQTFNFIVNLNFFINSNGSLMFLARNEENFPEELKNLNINNMNDPYNYLKNIFDRVLEEQNDSIK